jgi:hypothetical protein
MAFFPLITKPSTVLPVACSCFTGACSFSIANESQPNKVIAISIGLRIFTTSLLKSVLKIVGRPNFSSTRWGGDNAEA